MKRIAFIPVLAFALLAGGNITADSRGTLVSSGKGKIHVKAGADGENCIVIKAAAATGSRDTVITKFGVDISARDANGDECDITVVDVQTSGVGSSNAGLRARACVDEDCPKPVKITISANAEARDARGNVKLLSASTGVSLGGPTTIRPTLTLIGNR